MEGRRLIIIFLSFLVKIYDNEDSIRFRAMDNLQILEMKKEREKGRKKAVSIPLFYTHTCAEF